ncbi:uncharacterized protein METZ01_LOCUS504108, partial [marine metagenome]
LVLGSLMTYAQFRAPEVYSSRYRFDEGYVKFDMTQVHRVTKNSFTVELNDGGRKTFTISTLVPFKAGDVISFSVRLNLDGDVLEEFHVWESSQKWWLKVIVSFPPLIWVFVMFFREFSINMSRFMIVSRKRNDA